MNARHAQSLLDKLRRLRPERQAEVEDFVDFLESRDQERRLAEAAAKASEPAFRAVWDNDADADYDRL
jgi:hypothetical protein